MALDFATIPKKSIQVNIGLDLLDSIEGLVAVTEGATVRSWIAEACWMRAQIVTEDRGRDAPEFDDTNVRPVKVKLAPRQRRGEGHRLRIELSVPLHHVLSRQARLLGETRGLYVINACQLRLRMCNLDDATLTQFKRNAYRIVYPDGHEQEE